MPYCKVKNANIYYEEMGEGRPIIMIHGFTPDHRLMSGCMEPIFEKTPVGVVSILTCLEWD